MTTNTNTNTIANKLRNTNTNISAVSCSNSQLVRLPPAAERERSQLQHWQPTHFKDDPPDYLNLLHCDDDDHDDDDDDDGGEAAAC